MSKDVEFKLNPNFEKKMKKQIAKNFEKKVYIIVKRLKSSSKTEGQFEVVDGLKTNLKTGDIVEGIDAKVFENSEIIGGDPDVRKIRFRLRWEK